MSLGQSKKPKCLYIYIYYIIYIIPWNSLQHQIFRRTSQVSLQQKHYCGTPRTIFSTRHECNAVLSSVQRLWVLTWNTTHRWKFTPCLKNSEDTHKVIKCFFTHIPKCLLRPRPRMAVSSGVTSTAGFHKAPSKRNSPGKSTKIRPPPGSDFR